MDYSKPWIFEEIARGREEAYFRQKEAELIEELRRRFHQQQDRERLAEEVGVHDEQILRTFEELGFSRETVTILHLVPLVQVAWSDGGVTEAERAKLHEVAALRGATPGTPGYLMLEKLLDTRPSDRALDVCWRVIRAMFSAWPEEKRRAFEVSLPAYAAEVASVSGGLLGFRAISAEERTALQRAAREIAEAHTEAARTITESGSVAGKLT
jgi:DnaJ-domain-containing protein 1